MTTIRCTSCHRKLRRAPVLIEGRPFGPVCAASIIGCRVVRGRTYRRRPDERQRELFVEAHGG